VDPAGAGMIAAFEAAARPKARAAPKTVARIIIANQSLFFSLG
jgi:hypothetical protein